MGPYLRHRCMPADVWKTRTIALVIFGVLAWGLFHAYGAYSFNHDPRRGLIVLGFVLAFLGFWGLMLWQRARRKA